MSDTGWLVLAIAAGVVFGAIYIAREVWVQRRRGRRR
jgi:hypothetical protein